MAAPSCQEVDVMIQDALTAFEQRVGLHLRAQAADQVTVEQARSGLDEVTTRVREEFQNSEARINQLITSNNVTFAEHKAAMLQIVSDLQVAGIDGTRLNMALGGRSSTRAMRRWELTLKHSPLSSRARLIPSR